MTVEARTDCELSRMIDEPPFLTIFSHRDGETLREIPASVETLVNDEFSSCVYVATVTDGNLHQTVVELVPRIAKHSEGGLDDDPSRAIDVSSLLIQDKAIQRISRL